MEYIRWGREWWQNTPVVSKTPCTTGLRTLAFHNSIAWIVLAHFKEEFWEATVNVSFPLSLDVLEALAFKCVIQPLFALSFTSFDLLWWCGFNVRKTHGLQRIQEFKSREALKVTSNSSSCRWDTEAQRGSCYSKVTQLVSGKVRTRTVVSSCCLFSELQKLWLTWWPAWGTDMDSAHMDCWYGLQEHPNVPFWGRFTPSLSLLVF